MYVLKLQGFKAQFQYYDWYIFQVLRVVYNRSMSFVKSVAFETLTNEKILG